MFILETQQQQQQTPTLWLRLAQCCMREYDSKLRSEQEKAHNEKMDGLKQQPESPVPQRRLVYLPTREMVTPVGVSDSGDEMNLIFADKCLRNAHYLLLRKHRGRKGTKLDDEQDENKEEDEDFPEEGDGQLEESQLHAAAAEDGHLASVLQSLYSNMAYVALCLQNTSVALATCQKLLSLQCIYREHKLVCLSYTVEALCKLNRSREALELLNKQNLQDLITSVCVIGFDKKGNYSQDTDINNNNKTKTEQSPFMSNTTVWRDTGTCSYHLLY